MGSSLPLLFLLAIAAPSALEAEEAASLRGSPTAMQQQNRIAKEHGLAFYGSPADIRMAVKNGSLVELLGNADYDVADFVRHPYLHPALVLFVERLAKQYREACGQKLVVTSGVRPTNGQPANAHALSVHPAGMAVDLRVSDRASCRNWMDSALLNLEGKGLANGTREYRPPHYHVAVYPTQYLAYAEELIAVEQEEARMQRDRAAAELAALQGEWAMASLAENAASLTETDPRASDSEQRAKAVQTGLALLVVGLPLGLGYFLRRRRSDSQNLSGKS